MHGMTFKNYECFPLHIKCVSLDMIIFGINVHSLLNVVCAAYRCRLLLQIAGRLHPAGWPTWVVPAVVQISISRMPAEDDGVGGGGVVKPLLITRRVLSLL